MPASLTRFRIEKLHGRRTFDIPVVDNRLVLVGENGSGKSTVANLIYYFLTRQWVRLKDYRFDAIEATVSGSPIRITRDDLQSLLVDRSRAVHQAEFVFRRSRQIFLDFEVPPFPEDSPEYARYLEHLSDELDVPVSVAQNMLRKSKRKSKLPPKLIESVETLKSLDFGQFLYLPTYRRIEQDLKSIFRGAGIEEKIREFRDRVKKRERTFMELIEFGMEDVERTINERMAKIKESVREGLNNLTGAYLREVLRGLDDPAADVAVLRTIEPAVFESIFARIDETTLPPSDKELLKTRIASIALQGYGIGPDDKVIAHFLSKLVALHREQQASETDVRQFAKVCNAYLTGKHLVYDDVRYVIYIRQDGSVSEEKDEEDQLQLRMLSSGEKQIVSLFSHIYLSGDKNYFVIIDEPELSLSVPWQQRFLPDIISTERCTGMIAVTHSPFIWENVLEPYVHPLSEFVEATNVIR
ncbi:MAG TPA: AAA family ATPase [Terriglobales bacterium]|jgi:predicted ATPase|nr:AAA family ATPase [Terriglobales bacterium]